MTPAELSRTVLSTVRRAVEADELSVAVPERVVVERPRGPRQGDYATNVALRLARAAGRQPRQVAEILAGRLARCPGIARVEIADPGFLNITLEAAAHAGLVREVLAQGAAYGHNDSLAATRVTLAHNGEPRAAAVADAGNRLLRACGARPGPPEAVRVRPVGTRPDAPGAPARPCDDFPALTRDAARWALLRPPPGDTPRLDPAELLTQRESNPLFRVQYAHARTRALLRNARDLGIAPDPDGRYGHPAEHRLLGVIADFPRIVQAAARHRSPDRVARHLELTADAFFACHDACPQLPRGDEKPSAAHRARLSLAEAAGTVLAGGLTLLGISAPEHL
ncbi:ArgS-related anticodon-binding protein NrtL [Streptantibioticus rubrisoli]|uniref:arginine--tRNA ligase n=1 Tax=Streptantibioticus rubrisoli TaxID=1387313 RepID=A0ABT1PJ36_9ACTN|nr:DALR anticodon-binding domain-containing protein [Streptantibioticus rubrisoli]MCQ4045379.1 DALR anticodon-binding domain-containing protein [Streptantibioticus rubrisoli]